MDEMDIAMKLGTFVIIILLCIIMYQTYSHDEQCKEIGYDYAGRDTFFGDPYCQHANTQEKPRPWVENGKLNNR